MPAPFIWEHPLPPPPGEDNQVLKFGAISFGDILADPSDGFGLQFPSALQFAGEGVGTCSRHNLYLTGYTENDTHC